MIVRLIRRSALISLVLAATWWLIGAAYGTSAPAPLVNSTPPVASTMQPAFLPLLARHVTQTPSSAPTATLIRLTIVTSPQSSATTVQTTLTPGATPSPTSTSTPTITPTLPSMAWLQYVNKFRAAADLPSLSANQDWAQGEWLHSRYMVKEDHISHSENSSSSWYTEEGDVAGRNGNIFVSGWTDAIDEYAIDFWMAGPFHAVAILDPQLHQTAFGSYREDIGYWHMGATLDRARGLGPLPPGTTFPLPFPRNDGETWITQYYGGEWPDPLTSCPGYTTPTGPPLILQLGSGSLTPHVTAHSFTSASGMSLTHCVFDETNYSNPSASTQDSGRLILNNRDAIVLMPREPLSRGASYIASITADGMTYSWQFEVVTPPRAAYYVPEGMDHAIMR